MAAELPCLVIAPAGLLINWRREIEMWRPEDADQFTVLSYANPHLATLVEAAPVVDFRSLIVDEVHYIKEPTSQRSETVCRLIRDIGERGKVIALSGTLVPNRPIELWPLLYAMRVTPWSWERFARRYAGAYQDERGQIVARGATNLPELRRLLAPHVLRYTKADVMPELPPKSWRVLALDLPIPKREKAFSLDELEKMDAHVAFEAFSDVLRLHGERKVPKVLDHVRDVLENERKVIVFGWHHSVMAELVAGLSDYSPVLVHGGKSKKQRQAAIDSFQDDPSTRVIVGQLKAMGVGSTLTAAKRVVFAEGSWVPADLDQGADRAHRLGQRDSVTCDLLTIDGSIDEHMLTKALGKQAVIDQVVPDSVFGLDPEAIEMLYH